MKRVYYVLVIVAILIGVVGCQGKPMYKEGTYTGDAEVVGEDSIATAKVVIGQNGKIESVYLDETYQGTTKKTLGDDYNMKKFNPDAIAEWYEQVTKLEEAIVKHQGVKFINLNDDGKTDAVSGCTIKIDALYKAVNNALEKALNA